jgi:hypothetical protein
VVSAAEEAAAAVGQSLRPEAQSEEPGCTFYQLLRPELVRSLPYSLSPDAYSNFPLLGSPSPAALAAFREHNRAVRRATVFLHTHLVPAFAADLELEWHQSLSRTTSPSSSSSAFSWSAPSSSSSSSSTFSSHAHTHDLTQRLHLRGINVRHLMRVRSFVQNLSLRAFLLSECVAR